MKTALNRINRRLNITKGEVSEQKDTVVAKII